MTKLHTMWDDKFINGSFSIDGRTYGFDFDKGRTGYLGGSHLTGFVST